MPGNPTGGWMVADVLGVGVGEGLAARELGVDAADVELATRAVPPAVHETSSSGIAAAANRRASVGVTIEATYWQ